ncbi:restriction endonuclease subunit S [Microbacterium lacticum]
MSSTERIRSRLGDLTVSQDSRRRPVKSTERNPGPYPYYGASGIVDYVDSFIFEGLHLLIAEDGENLRSRNTPVAFLADGQFWVNNHAHVLQGNSLSDTRYLAYAVEQLDLSGYLTGSTQPKLTKAALDSVMLDVPPLAEQQAISEVLGALDDKIAANIALAANTASVAIAEYRSAIRDGGPELPIDEVSILLARGITPRYLPDGDGTRVLNQKCVRDQLVSLEPSRWTDDAKVKQEKLLAVGDILVNSTGQGTLGRVARWTLAERATVDSHITIVRPDPDVSDPAVIGQAILAIEADIEALGEGSTGQTELSRIELGRARVRIPSRERAEHLGAKLRALSACQDAARAENDTLTATRDALLPQLMSGKLRVHDAENLIDQAGV